MDALHTLHTSSIPSLDLIARGKVRDIYAIDSEHMLIVTSDRISAFDCILPDPIPGKGEVLTAVSNFWFEKLKHIVPNHLTGITLADVIPDAAIRSNLEGRAIVVKRLKALPIEAVVRGYLIGSGWKDYQAKQQVCGIDLPKGLMLAERLPEAIFTPSTKAELGLHDENISLDKAESIIGRDLAHQVREVSLQLYQAAFEHAHERGIIIADTKFEFGLSPDGTLHLIDEALTPDSSRFWAKEAYQVGTSPSSYDKQFVRDYLESLDWDKTPPAPNLPQDVIKKTMQKYQEAKTRLLSKEY